jgi:hypothetical protein
MNTPALAVSCQYRLCQAQTHADSSTDRDELDMSWFQASETVSAGHAVRSHHRDSPVDSRRRVVAQMGRLVDHDGLLDGEELVFTKLAIWTVL